MSDKTILERISEVTELNDISERMQDPKLDEAMDLIIRLTVKDFPGNIPQTIVKARALAAEFKLKGKYYMLYDKSEAAKKNIYLSVAEELVGLADAIKYLVRST